MGQEILIFDTDTSRVTWMTQCLEDMYVVTRVSILDEALARLARPGIAVWMIGVDQMGDSPGPWWAELGTRAGELPPTIVLADGPRPELATSELATIDVFHIAHRHMAPGDVSALVRSAAAGEPVATERRHDEAMRSAHQARQMQRVLDVTRRLAVQRNLAAAETACIHGLGELIDADRIHCLFFDAESGALWSEQVAAARGEDERLATCGLAGFAARTGAAMNTERASSDPRYTPAIDDPQGTGAERIAVQPVMDHSGQIHAVLVVVRAPRQPALTAMEADILALFAQQAGPLFAQLSLHLEAEALLEQPDDTSVFRREAVEAYHKQRRYGDVVRVSPAWVAWSYWSIVILVACAAVYSTIGTIDQYSSGPAVVRMAGRSEVTANLGANMAEVYVEPGQAVTADQLLARFYDAEQAAAVRRLEGEFAAQLRNRMLDPADQAVAQAVRQLRVERDRARSALEERRVRAPRSGVVSGVRVRPGQRVAPGETIMSVVDEDSDPYVVALLPGADRPQLAPGMPLRLELAGYRYAYQDLAITSIAAEVLGPAEARRVLGAQVADAIAIAGPVVVVRARLPGRAFHADGRTYRYHDGMAATAEVQVRSKSVLETLIPGLEWL